MKQSLPLSGVRICDLTQVMFGPCGTQVLGDFGADIIKIERPGVGDLSRTYDPFQKVDGGESAYFMAMNRNKRSLAVDITRPEGLAVVRKIVETVDVFVHNFRPGVVERIGLDYETLRLAHPGLIYAEGSGFGGGGPLVHKGGQDFLAQALSGLAERNRDASDMPQLYPTAVGDFAAGMMLAQGILLALLQRGKNGLGQKISLNLLDVMLVMQQQEVTQALLRQKSVNWLTQNPMDVFATCDGHIAVIAVFKPNPIGDICQALEIPDVTSDPRFATLSAQMVNRAVLREKLGEGFAKFSTKESLQRLESEDILCSPVLSLKDALSHPQVEYNGIVVEFEHPVHGRMRTVGNALKLSQVEMISLQPPPTLGQHNDAVLSEAGYDAAAIASFKADGIVQADDK